MQAVSGPSLRGILQFGTAIPVISSSDLPRPYRFSWQVCGTFVSNDALT